MKTLTIALLILIGAVSTSAQKVKVGSDPSVDVSKYKTYAWDRSLAMGNLIIRSTVMDAVDQALAAKGLRKVETDPELTIVVLTVSDSELHTAYPTGSDAMGSPSVNMGMAVGNQSWPVTRGTLIVDILDARTKNSVWRATASHTLEHGPTGNEAHDAKTVDKPIRKAVTKMFKQFPRPS